MDVTPLVSQRFAFTEAPLAYEALTADKSALGIVLGRCYPAQPLDPRAGGGGRIIGSEAKLTCGLDLVPCKVCEIR